MRCVSIPFKRESVSKASCTRARASPAMCFNSLQTGKRIQSYYTLGANLALNVSIPFKRESVSKVQRRFQSRDLAALKFQFPSNGKAYPKSLRDSVHVGFEPTKFQFPSNGKAYPKRDKCHTPHCRWPCFNSLQTGKRIQRGEGHYFTVNTVCVSIPFKRESVSKVKSQYCPIHRLATWFQFPSNGKAYPKSRSR